MCYMGEGPVSTVLIVKDEKEMISCDPITSFDLRPLAFKRWEEIDLDWISWTSIKLSFPTLWYGIIRASIGCLIELPGPLLLAFISIQDKALSVFYINLFLSYLSYPP